VRAGQGLSTPRNTAAAMQPRVAHAR
jgi:hypothetical protein